MGNYRIEIKISAVKEIENLPDRDIKAVFDKIASLAENPRPHDCQKLSGREQYRIRRGDYRILYYIEDDVLIVYIVKVGHRKDVYRGGGR
ncbi:MAG: type II toxin-antitoxin system RelE/ParE family toxin [Candidatus Ratteibacteria bacterium]|jgi:mRNA interferase RelE/StbE